jgi:glycosyltransferase involved in cell wall biosynthesis
MAPRVIDPIATLAPRLEGKRVAILSHSHPSLTKGGAEIAADTLFRGLREVGVEAIMISACSEDQLDRIDLGRDEFALPYRAGLYDQFYHISPVAVRRSLIELLQRERIDILNAHHFLHAGLGVFTDVAAAGIKVVYTIHEFLAICHNHGQLVTRGPQALCDGPSPAACRGCYPEHSRQQFAMRQHHVGEALSHVAAFVSPSRFVADKMIENGVPAERMTVIENGIPLRGPVPAIAAHSDRRVWKFGYFGQINPFKGIEVILDACAVIARDKDLATRVAIVVHGNFVGQSDEFVEGFEEAVKEYRFLIYRGAYDNRTVGRLMAACDYVVLPSTWWENSPVVIQEAYHARRPVICTGIGGMAEKVVDRVTGLHFERGDAGGLADSIAEAADPVLYRQLQEALPAAHAPSAMASRYVALFEQVIARPL